MGQFSRALARAVVFTIPAAGAFYTGYAVTGNFFRNQAVPVPFERFGFAVGTAAACFALAIVCFLRYLFRFFTNRRSQS
jgi:hypothetical protein